MVFHCRKCELHRHKTHYVFGEGCFEKGILFIGEAPGSNEDKQGRPFVGRAGKILDELLHSIGLERSDVYITNILKCRPPQNRNPRSEEIQACTGYLDQQLDIIQPRVIIPLGSFACQFIFEKFSIPFDTISHAHGKIFRKRTLHGPVSIFPMFHPAVATYNPQKKSILLEDIKLLSELISDIAMESV